MKDKPILFSTLMVQAIQEGRKTQTRRIVDYKPFDACDEGLDIEYQLGNIKCPYQIGQKLWVKENHYVYGKWIKNGISKTGRQKWKFKSLSKEIRYYDNPPYKVKPNKYRKEGWYKRSAFFMPKKYVQTWLEITNKRFERLQDITEEGATQEGTIYYISRGEEQSEEMSIKAQFAMLWDSLNKKRGYGWNLNPWVWVIEFKKIEDKKNEK